MIMTRKLVSQVVVLSFVLAASLACNQASAAAKAAAAQAPAPAVKPSGRLVVALEPPPHETNMFWRTTTTGYVQLDPMLEFLIGVNRTTGKLEPQLATSWRMAPDGKTWTINLRKGVQFHKGYGEFTAKDVVASIERIASKDSISVDAAPFRNKIAGIETPNDYQVVIRTKEPWITLDSTLASTRSLSIISKAQWDKEGEAGIAKGPAGTGPWQFKERMAGSKVVYTAVQNHWRQTPQFLELELRWAPEPASRLAMLMSGEAQMADLPRSLSKAAEDAGNKVISSSIEALTVYAIFGGNYGPGNQYYNPSDPLSNVKVRQALNKAVDRDKIIQVMYRGMAKKLINANFSLALPGWNPAWEKNFSKAYGYDPAASKRLLAEAGYPNGFELRFVITPFTGVPEIADMSTAIGTIDFANLGVKVTMENSEWSRQREKIRKGQTRGDMWIMRGPIRPVEESLDAYNTSGSSVRAFVDDYTDKQRAALTATVEPTERNRLLRDLGNYLYDQHAFLPLVTIPATLVVNPKAVGSFQWSGLDGGVFTSFEYVQKPIVRDERKGAK